MADMIVREREKTGNFTILLNECLQRTDISARARGVYAYIMTLPNDWILHKSELYKHFPEGKNAIDTAFKELMRAGYVVHCTIRDANQRIVGHTYRVYESCVREPE